ncbi:cytochrome P450 11B, mitochondrial-like [Heterodontus francisci]|uniref:cytochrome P450 11B, mitochondrial-like n=1 Tax=Heterodontus francisci TaxID=7792 RepID=UPI00355AFBC4
MKRWSRKVWEVPIRGSPRTVLPRTEGHASALWVQSRSWAVTSSSSLNEERGILPYEAIPSTGRNGWVNLYRLWMSDGIRNVHHVMTRNFNRLGPIYREKLGSKDSINIFQPEDIAVLFQSEGAFPKRLMLDPWVAHREYRNLQCGIFLKNGKEWRSERLVLNKEVICLTAVSKFAPFLEPVAQEFTQFVDRQLEAGHGVSEVNMMPDLFRFALESSFNLLYGKRLGLFADQVCPSSERFIGAVEDMLRTTIPLLHLPLQLVKRLNMKPWRDHVAAWDILFEHADQCVEQLVQKFKNTLEVQQEYSGILSELLLHSKLPVDIIKANVTELMVGSVDTTAHSLLFTLFELARNPSVQSTLHDEVTAAYQDAQGDVCKLLHSVPLLRGAIKETLRLYPIGITLQRYPIRDIVIQNYHIPAGTLVQAGLYSLGRCPDTFPDPQRYNPGRWLTSDGNYFRALAFGFGVRQCIGRRIAETEIALFLIHILRKFQIITRSKADLKLIYGFIVMVDCPPLLTFRPIDRQNQGLLTKAPGCSQLQP